MWLRPDRKHLGALPGVRVSGGHSAGPLPGLRICFDRESNWAVPDVWPAYLSHAVGDAASPRLAYMAQVLRLLAYPRSLYR
jgi:hypothetical protein